MSYTALEVITGAYYTSGIVARDFQTVDGSQVNDGLNVLNDILEFKAVEFDMVPYVTQYGFNTIPNQETYFIPNLIQISTMSFFLAQVRYAMLQVPRDEYWGCSRANNISSLPFTYNVERAYVNGVSGANVSMYFFPNQVYLMQIEGIFGLTQCDLYQDLSLVYDRFYITYLKYSLAKRLCVEYNYDVPAGVAGLLSDYENTISKRSQQLDLRNTCISTLSSNSALSYAQINLSPGWSPS